MAASASFGSLRSRKVDLKKALTVLRWTECPDLDETSSLNRTIPAVATGVEKEEEEEHHLQAALHASQAGFSSAAVVIPTPDASRLFPDSDRFYSPNFVLPKTLIKFSAQVEDCVGCPYCLDEVDDEFLSSYQKKCSSSLGSLKPSDSLDDDSFELLMHVFESLGNEKLMGNNEVVTLEEALPRIDDPKFSAECVTAVFEHWKRRRYASAEGKPIMSALKTDEYGLRSETDPYVCFRRREIKPVRKARRGDSASLEKLKRLRDELNRAKAILELVLLREERRKESFMMEQSIFEQRILVRRMKKTLGVLTTEKDLEMSPDAKKKKRKLNEDLRNGSTKIKIPIQKLKDAASYVGDVSDARATVDQTGVSEGSIDSQVKKRRMFDESHGWIDLTEDPYVPPPYPHPGAAFYERDMDLSLPIKSPTNPASSRSVHSSSAAFRISCGRRRLGRGGRIVIDRHVSRHDWVKLHPDHHGTFDWDSIAERWRFDNSDEEFNADVVDEIDDMPGSMAYRAYFLAPNQEEIYSLMTKPAFPDQIAPKPSEQKPPLPPPQVTRSLPQNAANTPTPAASASVPTSSPAAASLKKRVTKPLPSDVTPKAPLPAPTKPKKQPAVLDERTAALKRMMDESAEKAKPIVNLRMQTTNSALQAQVPSTNSVVMGSPTPVNQQLGNGVSSPKPAPFGLNGVSASVNGPMSPGLAAMGLAGMIPNAGSAQPGRIPPNFRSSSQPNLLGSAGQLGTQHMMMFSQQQQQQLNRGGRFGIAATIGGNFPVPQSQLGGVQGPMSPTPLNSYPNTSILAQKMKGFGMASDPSSPSALQQQLGGLGSSTIDGNGPVDDQNGIVVGGGQHQK